MSLKSKYVKDCYDVLHYQRKISREDYRKGIYFGSNSSSKQYLGYENFLRIKTNYEEINPSYPYLEMLQHNFENHIKKRHPDIHKWMIVAAVVEPDFVYKDNLNKRIYYFDRIIGKRYTRVVIGKDRKGNLYIVTAYNHSFKTPLDSMKTLIYRDLTEIC